MYYSDIVVSLLQRICYHRRGFAPTRQGAGLGDYSSSTYTNGHVCPIHQQFLYNNEEEALNSDLREDEAPFRHRKEEGSFPPFKERREEETFVHPFRKEQQVFNLPFSHRKEEGFFSPSKNGREEVHPFRKEQRQEPSPPPYRYDYHKGENLPLPPSTTKNKTEEGVVLTDDLLRKISSSTSTESGIGIPSHTPHTQVSGSDSVPPQGSDTGPCETCGQLIPIKDLVRHEVSLRKSLVMSLLLLFFLVCSLHVDCDRTGEVPMSLSSQSNLPNQLLLTTEVVRQQLLPRWPSVSQKEIPLQRQHKDLSIPPQSVAPKRSHPFIKMEPLQQEPVRQLWPLCWREYR